MHSRFIVGVSLLFVVLGAQGRARAADPPPPNGAHPRLFLTTKVLSALTTLAKTKGTATANFAGICPDTVTNAQNYTTRGGADGNTWPRAAVGCAFAYMVDPQPMYLTQAIKYWVASMEDDQKLGDKLGCTAGVDPNWQAWNGTGAVPKVILTVTHDTGYPMRWYGPFIALTYDWLHDAPGVSDALRAQTRVCLQSWVDYYTKKGYHNTEAGSNYNAGYVLGKTLAAVAMAGENGADSDRLWTETLNDVFQKLLIGQGLSGAPDSIGAPAGVMLGGDWGEGWQYGPLSVLEYAMAVRAVEESGVPMPEMDAWTNSLIIRYIHATVPHMDGHFAGGDFENSDRVYTQPNPGILDAVLAGPSSDRAAAWARSMMNAQKLSGVKTPQIGDVLAEVRDVTPEDYTMQTPAAPLWYLARGTRVLYARTAWGPDAFWGAFTSSPQILSDHHHLDASSFVFTRGGDHLIVDPSDYGCRSTLPTNALTADSTVVTGKYAPSQTPWGKGELPWVRATSPAVYAARADIAKAFNWADKPSDIGYAHREWAFLPEGEIVTIDRIRTGDASRSMYVNFHTNTAGTLKMDGVVAVGTVGASEVAIHPIMLSGGTPAMTKPTMDGNCYDGTCSNVRIPVDEYSVKVPGPFAVAIHVIDGLASGEERAKVGSVNDMTYDPQHENTGVIGAAVFRSMKQSYVIASSAQDGSAGASMAYSVPGGSSARHVVFDAPEDGDGHSMVTAAVAGDRCSVTIAPGAGFAGHPLMFQVGAVADGCMVAENTDVAAGAPPPGGGSETTVGTGGTPRPPGSSGGGPGDPSTGTGMSSLAGGCACRFESSPSGTLLGLGSVMAMLFATRRRRRR